MRRSAMPLAAGHGWPAIVAVLMGVVTSVCGGVLRDIVCNEIPSAFNDHRPYAVCAFAGGWVLVAAWGEGIVAARASPSSRYGCGTTITRAALSSAGSR